MQQPAAAPPCAACMRASAAGQRSRRQQRTCERGERCQRRLRRLVHHRHQAPERVLLFVVVPDVAQRCTPGPQEVRQQRRHLRQRQQRARRMCEGREGVRTPMAAAPNLYWPHALPARCMHSGAHLVWHHHGRAPQRDGCILLQRPADAHAAHQRRRRRLTDAHHVRRDLRGVRLRAGWAASRCCATRRGARAVHVLACLVSVRLLCGMFALAAMH